MKTIALPLVCLALVFVASAPAEDSKPAAPEVAPVAAAPEVTPAPAPAVAPTPAPAAAVTADPELPQPVDVAVAQPLIANPPFTRSLNLSDSLVLTGIAYINGKPVATVLNKATKESYVVSDEPNAQGWKLSETSASHTLARTQAKLVVGGEIVTIRYSDEPVADMNGPRRREGGEGGDSGRREGGSRGSEEDRQRFMSLSDNARSKFIEKMRESREKMGNASSEDRSAYVKKIFESIERDDKAGKFR